MGDAGLKEEIWTFDRLLRIRAVDEDQNPMIAYPKSPLGVTDYELINGETLNRFVDGAAKSLIKAGFDPVYEETIVGVYALSDLEYVVTIWGLGRLGYTAFLLSPRLPSSAVATLLKGVKSNALLHGYANDAFANAVRELAPEVKTQRILTREQYDCSEHASSPPFARVGIDEKKEYLKNYLILHSSGSTGLPKPITFSNKRLMIVFLTAQHRRTWLSVPYSHAFGMVCYTQAVYTKKTMYVMNGHVPQTHDTVTASIVACNPEIVWAVPYVLKLIAEKQDGIDALKKAYLVSSSGSRCPDDLGDLLVSQGIFLGLTFGATETASLFSSILRPRDDPYWNYMSVQPHVKPFILMRPTDDGESCEAIVLEGHRSRAITNSNDPPNSYHTSDLFVPHPTISDRWKFVGRQDDRITLLNGEKVLPLPIEGRIRAHELVREAVMFGIDRPVPGLLLFRSHIKAELSDEQFLNSVWEVVEEANKHAEAFSQISRDLTIVLGENVDCPTTDKASIKRAQIYRDFAKIIDEIYVRLENSSKDGPGKALSVPELEAWILEKFLGLNINITDKDADFFTSGVDSLKAIQMRGLIVKELDLGTGTCPSSVVYDSGNTKKLAEKLYELRIGGAEVDEDEKEIEVMKEMIEKYSKFETTHSERITDSPPNGAVVILTGATGSLGIHILNQLVLNPNVTHIYTLIRSSPHHNPTIRLLSAMKERNLVLPLDKITALATEFSSPHFGLSFEDFEILKEKTTHIIHCAWAVNFAPPVSSFESQIIALHELIELSLNSQYPIQLSFCSSVGAAMSTPTPGVVPSGPIPDFHHASPMGYGRSKLVGEKIVENAFKKYGANGTIMRIGQIIPARGTGSQLWNVNEMISLIVRSAVEGGVLPDRCNGNGGDECRWFEADVLAKAIIELGGVDDVFEPVTTEKKELQVYNLLNPKAFSWSKELLPKLKEAGLKFEVVSWEEWLKKLKEGGDAETNPSRKLLGFWEAQGNEKGGGDGEVTFETKKAEEGSAAVRSTERAVDGDLVGKLLHAWQEAWK